MHIFQYFSETFPPKPSFSVDHIPDLSGKVAIVTGANTGVGKETAKALLAHNAKVYLAARNAQKAEQAIKELEEQTGKRAVFLQLDLADLVSIRTAAKEFNNKESELHILFNNAGVMVPPIGDVTAQGYDLQFGTNVLGHFYLTQLLIPTLISTAKSSLDKNVRVINTSSSGYVFHSHLNFNTFKDGPTRRNMIAFRLYAQSKFGNIVFSNELARRYGSQGIVSTSLNPGNLKTELARHLPKYLQVLSKIFVYPVSYGALTQLWAGTSPEGAGLNGRYLIPWARLGSAHGSVDDPVLGKELWTWLEEQIKETPQ
ncbi:NAD(P)-binding protein [Infundibulicybe gibba]|nr:NAD(P)-binding protein [Infundibulicybe gibba]